MKNKPKSLQAQLQSRISKRAAVINDLEWQVVWAKKYSIYQNNLHNYRVKLKVLAEDQGLDKKLLANTYWR